MRRHSFDPISLICGAVFATAGGLVLAGRIDLIGQLRWGGPLLLIIAAVVLLLSSRRVNG